MTSHAAVLRFFMVMAFFLPFPLMAATLTVQLQDEKAKPLPDVVVTLQAMRTIAAPVASKATIAQIDKEFSPRVTVVPVGSQVWFPNRDSVRHHVYSFSATKKFDIKLYAGDPPAPVLFDKPGLVVLGCNIHDWMIAYIYVTAAPYFGKTDARGRLVLNDIVPGDYKIGFWHPEQSGPELVKTISVGDAVVPLQVTVPLKQVVP